MMPPDTDTPGRREMLALSLPSFIYAGYELARKSYLPVLLVGQAHLDMAQAGLILTVIGGWNIAVEVVFGMICDLAPNPRARRAFWVMVGTGLQLLAGLALWLIPAQGRSMAMWLVCLLTLASGWVLSNLAHGAWALERARGVVARGRIFTARAQVGMSGSIAFAFVVLLSERMPAAPDPYDVILILTMLGAPLAHALLIRRVEERGQGVPVRQSARRHLANVIKPFQVCFAAPADRWLALLFLLVGAHTSLIGSSFLFIARQRLALPEWGTAALLVQAVAAVLGIGWAQGLLRHASPLRIIMGVFALNLALALVVPALPRAQVAPLIGWAAATGATMAVDFTLLRVLLGQRLDREAARDGCAPAAAFYAGFHLPFNLGAMLAVALLFGGPDLGDGLAWWTAGLAALFSVLAMAGGMGMRRALVRECVEHLFSDARLMLIIN